jgi:hypothetical protein|tara:strand:- start:306 stop:614 length:309 start_codon:yes stop_codon:yes gene_type:complete
MFDKIKDGDLITLKLASGEEVIAKYLSKTDTRYISIEKALVLMQGPQGLAFGTFFSTAKQDEPFNIAIDKLISIAHINDKIAEEYKRVFSTIKTPEKPKIIT